MNKYWNQNIHLVEIMLETGKHKGRKDDVKLLQCVNKVKQKYNSLKQACHLTSFIIILMSKVHLHHVKRDRYVNCLRNRFTQLRIITNQKILFSLPDKKYKGERFIRYSLKCSARLYNLCHSTTRKISTSTYYHYKPKAVKLQGQIPFRQSCCER